MHDESDTQRDDRDRQATTGSSPPPNSRWRFAGLQSYEDDDALVVCDRENSRAWIRSDVVLSIRQ